MKDTTNGCDGLYTARDLNRFDDSYSSPKHTTKEKCKKSTKQENKCQSFFQCRYIVTLLCFFVHFEIDAYRLATSISVVAMINNSVLIFQENLNSTTEYCPMNDSSTIADSLPENAGDFNWSPEIQGYILGAGFLGYVIMQIPGGIMAETYGAKLTIVSGLFLSSVSFALCPFAAWYSSYLLIAMQLLRGLGQGLLTPAMSVLTANWFPRIERGFLNGLIMTGYAYGSLISSSSSGALCSSALLGGWPSVYYIYGGLGLFFCVCVQIFLFESPRVHPRIENSELDYIIQNQETDMSQKRPPTPWKEILTSVPVYAMTFGVFSHYWAITHQISVQPIYLGHILHYSIQQNGVLTSIPFIFQALFIFIGGWISKKLVTQDYIGINEARKWCTTIYALGYSAGVLGIYFAGCDRVWSNIFSMVAMGFIGLSIPGCLIVPMDMSPTFAGSLFGLSNTIASSASFLLPVITGFMLNDEQTLNRWNEIFFMCIGVIMIAGIAFHVFGSAEVQPWNFKGNDSKEEVIKDCSQTNP